MLLLLLLVAGLVEFLGQTVVPFALGHPCVVEGEGEQLTQR